MTSECIFCRIVAGTLPSRKVYEDKHCLAFLDRFQIAPGHCLVIPKRHVVWLTDQTPNEAARFGRTMQAVAAKMKQGLGAEYVSVLIRGTRVPHLHALLIPKLPGEDNIFDRAMNLHHFMQERLPEPTAEQLDALAARIRDAGGNGA